MNMYYFKIFFSYCRKQFKHGVINQITKIDIKFNIICGIAVLKLFYKNSGNI